MNRYKIEIEYKGTSFSGWQKQHDCISVQEVIEKAIFSFSQESPQLFAAGRTDAGVHALGQVAHFELAKDFSEHEVQGAINHFVKPHPISILKVSKMDTEFHARFSAKSRSYIYKIICRPAPLAILNNLAWQINHSLDINKMHDAAQILIGKHDLTSFRSTGCQAKNPVRNIDIITVSKVSEEEINIYIKAPSFLHNQVRIIVGCLYELGIGKITKKDLQNILEAKDRTKASFTAPPEGLYLLKVEY